MIRQLAGHTAAYTFANLASRGTVLAWLLILPSFMGAAAYGALGLIITAAALVNFIVPLEVSQALARYYPPANPVDKAAFVTSAWSFTLTMLGLGSLLGLIFAIPLCRLLLGDLQYLSAYRLAVGFFLFNTLFTFIQNQLRWDFRVRAYTLVTLLFAVVTLAGSVGLAALWPRPLEGVIIGQAIGAVAGVAAGALVLRRSLRFDIHRSKLATLLKFSLPIVPASLALFFSIYASRFILRDLLDLRDVGVFTWASQLASIPALLLLGLQGALTPLVMKNLGEDGTAPMLARTFEAIVAAELLLCLGLAAFTPEFVRLLGYSQFIEAAPLVLLLAPANVMLQLYIFAPGFAIAEKTHLQMFISVIAALVAVVANYVLIAGMGLYGAGWASLAAATIFLGGWFLLSQRLYRVPVRWGRIALLCAGAVSVGWTLSSLQGFPTLAAIGIKTCLLTAFGMAISYLVVRDGTWEALRRRRARSRT
ncbi:oligosaccharide flippase family protein [Sphingomonas sinipercae]|uniref:Oligosaccharide flippase family protein n=1 Tax=Sphingomonas sinipercae TaxID=2714944 RepID=A0A6G7ZN78_9SPHN|nr:oligosaccharide flippase family protein [Sphingomonas sinipercae]QIL02431.1 oligosaccharide flippase family protein [Sphingomonas sinipercae]